MLRNRPRPTNPLALGVLSFLIAGVGCPFKGIQFFSPGPGELVVETTPIDVTGRTGRAFDPLTTVFEVNGVDLISALGLTPPFTDESGFVTIGPDVVAVSGLSYDPTPPGDVQFAFVLDGLSVGDYLIEVASERNSDGAVVSRTQAVSVVGGFSQAVPTFSSAGLPGEAIVTGVAGAIANQAVGQAVAAPPVSDAGGGEILSGHIEAVEETIAAGGP